MDLPPNLLPTQSQRVDYAIAQHFITALPGVLAEHIVEPDFWQHLAAKFRVNDRIEVVAADGSFDAELRVIALDPRRLWAQVRVLRMTQGEAAVQSVARYPDEEGYTIEYDPHHKWRIVRGKDLLAKDFPDKVTAETALANLKAVAPAKRRVA